MKLAKLVTHKPDSRIKIKQYLFQCYIIKSEVKIVRKTTKFLVYSPLHLLILMQELRKDFSFYMVYNNSRNEYTLTVSN